MLKDFIALADQLDIFSVEALSGFAVGSMEKTAVERGGPGLGKRGAVGARREERGAGSPRREVARALGLRRLEGKEREEGEGRRGFLLLSLGRDGKVEVEIGRAERVRAAIFLPLFSWPVASLGEKGIWK